MIFFLSFPNNFMLGSGFAEDLAKKSPKNLAKTLEITIKSLYPGNWSRPKITGSSSWLREKKVVMIKTCIFFKESTKYSLKNILQESNENI